MKWFRMYSGVLNDPKVQRLSPFLFKSWVNLLCCAAENEGEIPDSYEDIAFILRISEENACLVMDELQKAGLLESSDHGIIPHNWRGRQYDSDTSTDRVRRYRDKQRNVTETFHETPSRARKTDSEEIRTDSDTDTEEIREDTDTESLPSEVCAPSALPAPARESLKRFAPPSVEEVEAFMSSPPLHQPACARPFHDYYTSVGWRRGKNPIKDWRAAARGWCSREAEKMTPNGAKANTTLQDLAEETHRERAEMQRRGSWLGGSGNRPP